MERFLDNRFDCHIIPGRIHFHAAHVPCADVRQILQRTDLVFARFYDFRIL